MDPLEKKACLTPCAQHVQPNSHTHMSIFICWKKTTSEKNRKQEFRLPFLKLTARPWKWMVFAALVSYWGPAYLQGWNHSLFVSGSRVVDRSRLGLDRCRRPGKGTKGKETKEEAMEKKGRMDFLRTFVFKDMKMFHVFFCLWCGEMGAVIRSSCFWLLKTLKTQQPLTQLV